MIVVDTNILVYLYIDGARTGDAQALLRQDHAWSAPRLWRSELRNVLTGYLRRGSLDFASVCHIVDNAHRLLAAGEHDVDSRAVFELVRDSNCTAYDCEFIALAMQLGTRVVTADKKLISAFPTHAVAL